jgi:class 3 adenylate cyclase/tetratricopeptide (TPR) repeat protein
MDDVARWLRGLGLQQYAETFDANKIDFDSLCLLSDQDLQQMQVPLGPRRKLLAAIGALTELNRPVVVQSQGDAERRHVTALFCDLVASTEYAVRLDPEDFLDLTNRYIERCSSVIRDHNGTVVSVIGDAFLALFGYPTAEEDDADRSLRAALDILRIAPSIEVPDGPPVQVRVGIATGLAVAGGADSGRVSASGPIPNLAQRLQTAAAPQTILIDQRTYDATAGAFEFTDLGLHTLKGFAEPVQAWRVEQSRLLESRFAKKTRLFKLVGRLPQLHSIVQLWDGVVQGRGRIVVLSGEPGIGKSRLAFEVRQQIRQCTHLALQCSANFSNSALFPFLTLLKRNAGIRAEDPARIRLDKLEAILATSEAPKEMSISIFARLLSIDQTEFPLSELSSLRQQGICRRVLLDWLHHMCTINPVLISFEDVQWIDPSSRDILDALIEEAPSHRMLMIVTSRTSVSMPEASTEHVLEIPLTRLSRREAEKLADDAAAGADLSGELREHVLNRGEGVPLFIEELTRAAIETGLPAEHWEQEARQPVAGVPTLLRSLLVSRLDKLGSAKAIAQIAAVIGREFDLKLLSHLCGLSSSALEVAMERLADSGLVAPQLSPDRLRYAFTHSLLQEAARSTLLRERRQELHGLVAHAIETLDPKTAAEHPELLAQHFAAAGMFGRAADCWLAAGLNVAKTWAKVEAANMFAMGLACLERLPPSRERSQKAERLELERGDVLYATFGYVTPEGSAAYRNAMRLSQELGDAEALIRALDGLFGIALNSARFLDAEWASDQLIELGRKGGSLKALVLGLQFKGMSLFCGGSFRRARNYLERSLKHEAKANLVGSDFPSMAMLYLSWTFHILGYPQRARELYGKADVITRQQSAYRRAACLGNGCLLLALQRDPDKVGEFTAELLPLAQANGLNLWLNMASFFFGWIMVNSSRDLSGLERMQKVCDDLGEQEIDKSCYLALLADSYLQANQLEKAAAAVEQGLAHVRTTGERYLAAELIRLRGDVELRLKNDPEHAEALFREAIALSRKQAAQTWEIKATRSLKALLYSLGRQREIDDELAPILARFDRSSRGRRPHKNQ